MTINDFLALPYVRWLVPVSDWWENAVGRIKLLFREKEIMKIAVVGDLSMQEHSRLDRVLTAALAAADLVVQIGDIHSAYGVVQKHLKSGRLFVIPGNHDDRYDSLGIPRQWLHPLAKCTLVGLDNSNDHFNSETWAILAQVTPEMSRPLFVFAHKPISNVILSDGSENHHVMSESGTPASKADAIRLQGWLRKQKNCMLISGHYHGWSCAMTDFAFCIIEGRGGAAPDLGYTTIVVTSDGMSFHKNDLD